MTDISQSNTDPLLISFEVFPPKTDQGLINLGYATSELTTTVAPTYISVTYGAGGSSRDRSFAAIDAVTTHGQGTAVAAHLTCVGQSRTEIEKILDRYEQLGVSHIVALRGDPPEGIDAPYRPHPDGFSSTAELVAAIKARGNFRVSVSAYPEVHLQSPSLAHDLDLLASKIDAGADAAMTQMFFDNDLFERYRQAVTARGLDVAIIPGVFPIHSFESVTRFATRCGATMPASLVDRFAPVADDLDAAFALAADVAAEQIIDLANRGVDHVHLYTLNKSALVLATLKRLQPLGRLQPHEIKTP